MPPILNYLRFAKTTTFNAISNFISLMSYLDFLHGLHVDAAALAVLHESRVEGIHQDDSAKARSLLALHVVQKHLSFVDFVTDDCGDVS